MLHQRHAVNREPVAPVLLIALEDTNDVGDVCAGAVNTLLQHTDQELLATFDVDQMLNYRDYPPTLHTAGVLYNGISWPELRLEWATDTYQQDWLLLHGPSPTHQWRSFGTELAELAQQLGVTLALTLDATPAPVPHTRPCRVLATSTSPNLVEQIDPYSRVPLMVTAGIEHALAWKLGVAGISTVCLSAQVPSYLANGPYPPASAALLDTFSTLSGVSIDTDRLHSRATHTQQRIDEHLAADGAHTQRVRALERHFDHATNGDQHTKPRPPPCDDELADELSRWLHNHDDENLQ